MAPDDNCCNCNCGCDEGHEDYEAYDLDDPKRHALDPNFDPDLIRDIARGK